MHSVPSPDASPARSPGRFNFMKVPSFRIVHLESTIVIESPLEENYHEDAEMSPGGALSPISTISIFTEPGEDWLQRLRTKFPNSLGKFFVIIGCLFSAMNALLVKELSTQLSLLHLLQARAVFAVFWILLYMVSSTPHLLQIHSLMHVRVWLISLLCCVAQSFFVLSINELPISQAVILMSCTPILVALFSLFIPDSKSLNLLQYTAGVFGCAGVLLVSKFYRAFPILAGSSTTTSATASAFSLIGAAFAFSQAVTAASVSVIQKLWSKTAHFVIMTAYPYLLAIVLTLAFNVALGHSLIPALTPKLVGLLALVSLFNCAASLCGNIALRIEQPYTVSVLGYLWPVFSTILDICYYSYTPEPLAILGMVMILGSSYFFLAK
eukprot:TRINITY_DN20294_c0_g1_i2.p1 TRINITY_DN20294_c0_g1~~TRINITY_DN20294_c0_g1_i2.p1  ORF type:complete len:382 (-),score=104.72 TRINITY_DN20294_c0_g1_i2:198-1343(-)